MSKLALVLALSLPLEAALCGGYVLWNAWRASDRAAPTAPAAPASLPVTPTAPAARPAHFRSRVCFLGDVTGDGVGELSGFVRRDLARTGGEALAMIDGATGAILWEDEPSDARQRHVLCLGDRHVAVVDQRAFELAFYSTAGPTTEVRRALSDAVRRYGIGDSCVRVETSDRAVVDLSFDGADAPCDAPPTRQPHIDTEVTTGCVHGILSTLDPLRAASGELEHSVTTRRPGTEFLEVAAARGERELWRRTLRFVPVGGEGIGELGIVAAPGVVVTFGSERSDPHSVFAIGLSAETGAERYVTPLAGTAGRLRGAAHNGRFVIVSTGGGLYALHPETGAIAWQL